MKEHGIAHRIARTPSWVHGLWWIGTGVAGVGCLPEPQYPLQPVIGFESMELTESGGRELVLSFTDGDGDIGLGQGDTLPPFCTGCAHHQNLKLEYEELRDGAWTPIPLNPEIGQVPFYYRVPRVTPTGQNPTLQGTIALDMPAWYLSSPYDTLRFQITLWDRSLNASNTIYTPALFKP
jgi:hypothetical protein